MRRATLVKLNLTVLEFNRIIKAVQNLIPRLLIVSLLCVSVMFVGQSAIAAPPAESQLVAEARELIDTYYGNRTNLTKSAELLERAHREDPTDANVFIQAARVTVMGGYLKFDTYETGTLDRYAALLDRAISLDKTNPKAYILRAQVFERQERYQEQFKYLERAKALGTADPWLKVQYGSHYRKTKSIAQSYEAYSEVERRGPGSTASERKAYITAIRALSTITLGDERAEDRTKKYAAIALKARYPTDAWTPLGYAEDFIDYQLFDDAIFYAREALKTMEFGAGRLTLAASLYARAAQLTAAGGRSRDIEQLVNEAKKFGFSKTVILEYLLVRRGIGGSLNVLAPALNNIIR